jgi:hypothetical protein
MEIRMADKTYEMTQDSSFDPQPENDSWTLTTDQMIFMLQYHNAVEAAYANDDMDFLRSLAASEAFVSVFGEMIFDEAYDRYESTLEDDHADSSMAS